MSFLMRAIVRALLSGTNSPEQKGRAGERHIHNALTRYLEEPDYRTFTDLTLRIPRGTTQIDHLVLSRFGVFVIETKNMSGWIFGSADQRSWTQVLKGGKRRRFQNPLRQNFGHLKAVEGVLGIPREKLHGYVVFIGDAVPKTDMPAEVAWGLRDLGRLIGRATTPVFTASDLIALEGKLAAVTLEDTRETRRAHVEHVQRTAAHKAQAKAPVSADAIEIALCPKCGSPMARRTNRKTGSAFLGCTQFPKCRGVRQLKT